MKVAAIILSLVLIGGAFYAGRYVGDHSAAWKLAQANRQVDAGGGRMPLWAALTPCRESTPEELQQDHVALLVLSTFDAQDWSDMRQAAISNLAHTWDQNRSSLSIGAPEPCWPDELAPAITTAAIKAKVFSRPFLYANSIALAEQLGPRNAQIVDAVARSAFSASSIPENEVETDSRPYARLVLAEFGILAKPWANKAASQISADDEMGTGAAQIAVAGNAPGALQRVHDLLEAILNATPADQPIPRLSRNRFYELAVALGMGGEAAQSYSGPIVELLHRKVESWAPPFGMISTSPVKMCAVAEHIGGAAAEAAKAQDFCSGPKTGVEQ